MSNECCCAVRGGSSVTAQRQRAWVQINLLPTHPNTCQIHAAQRTLREFSRCTIPMGRGLQGGLLLRSQFLTDQGILPSCLLSVSFKVLEERAQDPHVKTHLNSTRTEHAFTSLERESTAGKGQRQSPNADTSSIPHLCSPLCTDTAFKQGWEHHPSLKSLNTPHAKNQFSVTHSFIAWKPFGIMQSLFGTG